MAILRQVMLATAVAVGTFFAWALLLPGSGAFFARLGLPFIGGEDAGGGVPSGFGGGFGAGSGGGQPPAIVVGAPVGEGRSGSRIEAIGDGRALRSVAVTPLAGGKLVALEVASGAAVAVGDVIARLDSDLEAIAFERAELAVADAEATFERVSSLRGRGAATDVQEREARLALERARLEARDAALALERRVVRAPFPGTVGILSVDPGAQVTTTTEIAIVEDRSRLIVEFRVPERAVGALAVGDRVRATALARPEAALEGVIAALDNRVDPDSRTLKVQAELENAEDGLRAGMAFVIEIDLPGAVYPEIDALAVQWGSEGPFVWVEREGRAARVPVRIVRRNAEQVLVAGALAPGDRVVTEGLQRLREGVPLVFMGDPPPAPAPQGSGLDLSRAPGAVSGG